MSNSCLDAEKSWAPVSPTVVDAAEVEVARRHRESAPVSPVSPGLGVLLGLLLLGLLGLDMFGAPSSTPLQPSEAEAHLFLTDGSSIRVSSEAQFSSVLESLPASSVRAVVSRGNGHILPIQEAQGKLAEKSYIFLNQGDTVANGQSLSQDFPGSVVRGVDGNLQHSRSFLGGVVDTGEFRYFRNGKEVDPTIGGAIADSDSPDLILSHPFTRFGASSAS